jgi:nitrate reductase NapAB chaperone NapD
MDSERRPRQGGAYVAFTTKEGQAEFSHPKAKVFAAVLEAIPTVKGMKVKSSDEASGQILAATGVSFKSWGEKVPIAVSESGPGKSIVSVTSQSKMALVDWGKNKQNLERILAATDRILSSKS